MKLKEIAKINVAPTLNRYFGTGDSKSETVHIYGYKSFENGRVNPAEYTETKYRKEVNIENTKIKERYQLKLGDIVFKLTYPFECAIVEDRVEKNSYFSTNFCMIRCSDPKYRYLVAAFLSNRKVHEYLKEKSNGHLLKVEYIKNLEIIELDDEKITDINNLYKETLNYVSLLEKQAENQKTYTDAIVWDVLVRRKKR